MAGGVGRCHEAWGRRRVPERGTSVSTRSSVGACHTDQPNRSLPISGRVIPTAPFSSRRDVTLVLAAARRQNTAAAAAAPLDTPWDAADTPATINTPDNTRGGGRTL